jgi:hypothetical protein
VAQPEPRLEPNKTSLEKLENSCAANLTGLEGICREEWKNLPKYRCTKLIAIPTV